MHNAHLLQILYAARKKTLIFFYLQLRKILKVFCIENKYVYLHHKTTIEKCRQTTD